MLVVIKWSNGEVVFHSNKTGLRCFVINELATVSALSRCSNVQGTRGYIDRKQSDVISIFVVR